MVSKNNSALKTLKISKQLHKDLSDLGGKGDTFEFIIRRLIIKNKALEESLKKLDESDRLRLEKKMEAEYDKFL